MIWNSFRNDQKNFKHWEKQNFHKFWKTINKILKCNCFFNKFTSKNIVFNTYIIFAQKIKQNLLLTNMFVEIFFITIETSFQKTFFEFKKNDKNLTKI